SLNSSICSLIYSDPPSVHIDIYSKALTPSNLLSSSTIPGTSSIPAMLIPQRHTNTPTTDFFISFLSLV
ncbi:MAG: hypothetical protein ACTSP8_08285, partial [Promethearchaeota archaeon]